MMMFEIYTEKSKEETMEVDIDTLFGYPKGGESPGGTPRPNILTVKYRNPFKHPEEELWAAAVDTELQEKCAPMSEIEREKYYINQDLVTFKYLIDNHWFPDRDPSL